MEAATWNGPEHPAHVDAARRCAREASGALREAAPARAGDGGAGGRRELMVELAGARLGRRARSTSAARRPSPATDARCATRASSGCSAPRSRAPSAAEILRGARLRRGRGATTGSTSTVPALPPRRRHARGRPRRGGRAHRRARQAPGHAADAPRRDRRARRPSSGCAAAPRTRSPAPACTRSSAGRSPRPSSSTACGCPPTTRAASAVALRNPMSEEQAVMRTTLLGSLLDVARRNRARGMPDVAAVRDRRDLPRPAARRRRRPRPSSAAEPLPDERPHVGALLTGADAAAVVARAASRRGPTSSPSRACSRRCSTRCACRGRVEPAREPFLHPGRVGARARRRRARRLARRDAPGGRRARGTSTAAARLRGRPRRWSSAAARTCRATRT